jgi:hypothetical protein
MAKPTPVPYYSLEELLLQREYAIDLLEDHDLGDQPTNGFFDVLTLQVRLAVIEEEIAIAADLAADEFEATQQRHPTARPFDQDVD